MPPPPPPPRPPPLPLPPPPSPPTIIESSLEAKPHQELGQQLSGKRAPSQQPGDIDLTIPPSAGLSPAGSSSSASFPKLQSDNRVPKAQQQQQQQQQHYQQLLEEGQPQPLQRPFRDRRSKSVAVDRLPQAEQLVLDLPSASLIPYSSSLAITPSLFNLVPPVQYPIDTYYPSPTAAIPPSVSVGGSGDNDDDDDAVATWFVISVLTTALIIMIVTAIRSCGLKASWLTGSSSSSSSASSSATLSGWHNGGGVGTSGSGGGAGGRARGGRGYAAHPVPTWEEDPNATEERLAALTDTERQAYDAAQAFQLVYPPNSVPTDISLSQYLSIQEKGVSAWEFEASYDHQLFVHDRTELSFYDQVACVQTNLPLPKQQEVYYWEVKMFEKSPNTIISVGVSTKPFPTTRLPGWNRHSVGYFSNNGQKYCNSLWSGYPYGPIYFEGDVIGCGYRPRNGTIFFTRNGRRIEDAYTGFGRTNLFPTVGATGPCVLHVNFGQSGFVFVEANVKKWGLAPASGSLAPPPAYGKEVGSILLEASGIMPAGMDGSAGDERERGGEGASRPRPILQSSSSRTQLLNGQPPGGHDGRSSPVQISEANMSAPPPNYSSLDRYGHPRPVGQGNVDGQQRHPSQDNGAAADDDSISIASTDSDESATLLLGNARPQLEDDYDDSGPHGANGGGGS